MPRSSNDYSAKQTVSPEVKNISAKRLYRGVMDCVRKLDASHQHRRNLNSLFQAEQVKLRHKLREACEKLMFSYPLEYGRKAEELLWKKVCYDVIHAVKAGRKTNAPGTLQQRHLEPHYRQFLYSAIGFYHYLLLRLHSKVKSGVIQIDFPLASRDLHHTPSMIANQHKSMQENNEKEIEDWVKSTTYRILVCLGDLSRYQMEFGVAKSTPIRYYLLALLARPNAGMPHNQLATIAGHNSWWGLIAAYHYCRSLHAEMSFEGAEGNIQKLLDRNKKLFYQLPTDALDGIMTAEVYKKEHTRVLIISFLYLCDLLRPRTYATDVETSGLCKRLIDALHVCLNHMDMETLNDVYFTDDLTSTDSIQPSKRRSEAKRYGIRSTNPSTEASPASRSSRHHHHPNQQRLNGDIVFKMCVMCLINVHDLQSCRSNRSSAAIAFTLAFFSHLLGFLIQQLRNSHKKKASQDEQNEESGKCTKADGDNVAGRNEAVGKSKKKSRLRRRRRMGRGENDDLSEGEEDLMGGGDAPASDSDLSGSEEEDDSDTLSESSGSENRLSQEDLSSEGDEDSTETDLYSPKDDKPVTSASPPSLAVASLQDLSNKMFQPPSRRKIMLAPSFLQNLTPVKEVKPKKADELGGVKQSPSKDDTSSDNVKDEKTNCKSNGNASHVNGNDVSKEETEAEKEKEELQTLEHLHLLTRHHHVMAAVKLLSDWLTMNEGVAAACAKNSRALWSRLVRLINYLPAELTMMKNEKIRNDAICSKQLDKVIECLKANEEEMKAEAKAREEAALKEANSKEKKIKIEKRKPTGPGTIHIKKPRWRVATALPEDYAVHMMKAVKESAVKTGVDLSQPYDELSDLQQCVIRTCRLRHLCRFLSSIEGVEVEVLDNGNVAGDETFSGPEEEVVDPQMELEAVEVMRKARLMKDMAASRLRNEVQALETSLGTPKSRDSALCLYLVPDTATLCSELVQVRRLMASERFFVIISKTVIDGLDSLKKEQQGARDAIRYLEAEFKKSNRFIRAQANDEAIRGGLTGEKPKLRRQDPVAWRFYRMVECCRYLLQQEAKKTNTEIKDHSGLVTILSQSKDESSSHLESAVETAKSFGIQVNSASAFVQSWSKNNT